MYNGCVLLYGLYHMTVQYCHMYNGCVLLYGLYHMTVQYCHMYNGCVVCEVRDHRSFSCSDGSYDRYLLLLRPTAEV